MALLDSLLDAIIRLNGDALVMHVGEKPYVVTTSNVMNAHRGPLAWGQVELSSRPLTPEAVLGMLAQILPDEQRQMLEYLGAVEHELPAPDAGQPFLLTAARGGDDIWVEVRRKPLVEELEVSPAESDVAPSEQPAAEPATSNPAITQPSAIPEPEPLPAIAESLVAAVATECDVPAPIIEEAVFAILQDEVAQAEAPADLSADSAAWVAPAAQADAFADEVQLDTEDVEEELHIDLSAALAEEDAIAADGDALIRLGRFESAIAEQSRMGAAELENEPGAVSEPAAAAQVEVAAPVEAAGSPEIAASVEVAAPAEAARPAEIAAPVQIAASVDLAAPVEVAVSMEAAAEAVSGEVATPQFAPEVTAELTEVFEAEAILAAHQEHLEPAAPAAVVAPQATPFEQVPGEPVAPVAAVPAVVSSPAQVQGANAEAVAPEADAAETAPAPVAAAPETVLAVTPETTAEPQRGGIVPPASEPPAVAEPHVAALVPPVSEPQPVVLEHIAAAAELPPVAAQAAQQALEPQPVVPEPIAAELPPAAAHVARQAVAALTEPPQPARDATPQVLEPAPTVVPLAKPSLKLQPPPAPPVSVPAASTEASLVALLKTAASRGASTLYAVADARPMVRVAGAIALLGTEAAVSGAEVDRFTFEFAPREHVAERTPEWTCAVKGVGRVRCVTFHDDSGTGLIFHLPSPEVSTADELGLSARIQALCEEADGLVVIAAPRNNGKSTLLDAFVDLINRTRYDHVITIESQIRTAHEKRHSFISQRLSDPDGEAIAAAARAALREGPDVLVIEDLRAPEALSVALDAARAGRLVFGGIAAPTAAVAVERLVGPFPADRRPQVRALLATSLRSVVAQALVRKPTGGRVGARELLLNSPAVEKLILDGSCSQLPLAIEGGRRLGMVTMNDALGALVRDGEVTVAEAVRAAADRASLVAALERDGIDVSGVERRA